MGRRGRARAKAEEAAADKTGMTRFDRSLIAAAAAFSVLAVVLITYTIPAVLAPLLASPV